jgi:hypothetical protein
MTILYYSETSAKEAAVTGRRASPLLPIKFPQTDSMCVKWCGQNKATTCTVLQHSAMGRGSCIAESCLSEWHYNREL